jgi:hypothetical protein
VYLLIDWGKKGSSFSICAVLGMPKSINLPVLLSSIVSCSIIGNLAGMKTGFAFEADGSFRRTQLQFGIGFL